MSSKQNLQDFSLCLQICQICIVIKRLLDALDRLRKIGF